METEVYSQRRMAQKNSQKQMKRMKQMKRQKHRKVFICSPFRPEGRTKEEQEKDLDRNLETARRACEMAVENGYIPLAPHLYFSQFLSDADAGERELGIRFGNEWLDECDELWVFGTRVTEGMAREIALAEEKGIPVIKHIFAWTEIEWFFDMLFGSGKAGEYGEHNCFRQKRCGMHRTTCRHANEDNGVEEDDYTRYFDEDEEGLLYDED